MATSKPGKKKSGQPPPMEVHRKPRGKKSVHWRKDPVILERLIMVERLHLRGDSTRAIGAALKVDHATIIKDLLRLKELWLERAGNAQEELRSQAVAELDDVRRRALAAAEFDEQAERAVLFGKTAAGKAVTIKRDFKGSAQFRGNKAAALNTARQASMDKAKVLGLIIDKKDINANVTGLADFLGSVFDDEEQGAGDGAAQPVEGQA